VQANGNKEDYGIHWNGRNIYEDGVEIDSSFEGSVVGELHNRGFPTPPAQDEEGYTVVIFVKGAGGWAGGRHLGSADGGWSILGDWAIDSIQGQVPEGSYWWSGRRKQIGSVAHELGHGFGLPHPEDWGRPPNSSIMGTWWDYPTPGLNDLDKNHLLTAEASFFNRTPELLLTRRGAARTDFKFPYGLPGDTPVVGDWDRNGVDTPGVVRVVGSGLHWFLRNSNTGGFGEIEFSYGLPGDIPVVGDWNGDGIDTPGVYRPDEGRWYLRNSNTSGIHDITLNYGLPTDIPVVGDWNGDGIDTPGVYRPDEGCWWLKNDLSTNLASITYLYGLPTDRPVAGDWNCDGIDTAGVMRDEDGIGRWWLKNGNTTNLASSTFLYGNTGDRPIAGGWNGTCADTIGVARRY